MFEPIDFPTSLPTWPSPKFPKFLETEDEPVRSRVREGKLGAVAIAISLVLGGLAWAYWRSKEHREAAPARPTASSAKPEPVSTPTPQPLWLPRTGAELDQLAQTTRAWMKLVPHADDLELARVVWGFHWRGVPFPRPSLDVECPAALELLERVIAAVRAEDAEPASDTRAKARAEGAEPQATLERSRPNRSRQVRRQPSATRRLQDASTESVTTTSCSAPPGSRRVH